MLPTEPGPDVRRILVKALGILLPRKPRELGMKGMIGSNERLFSVQDGRVPRLSVVTFTDPERLQVNRERFGERRMGVGLKVRVCEIRNLRLACMKLDEVCTVDATDVAAGTALVEPEQGMKALESALMNIGG